MSNRPAGLTKRILAALIDFALIVISISIVMEIINLTPLASNYTELANKANEIYNSIAVSIGIGELVEDSKGVLSLSLVSNYTSEDITYFNSLLTQDSNFMTFYDKAMNLRLLINILVIGIVEVVYLFLIPFLNKKGQTLGKMVLKLGVVDIRYDMYLDRKNKTIRFLVGFVIETVLLLWLFKESSPIMVAVYSPLIVLSIIMFSQNKQALHDIFSHAKVVDLLTATIFNSVEEKNAYDASLTNENNNESSEDVIEAEIKEVKEQVIEGLEEE